MELMSDRSLGGGERVIGKSHRSSVFRKCLHIQRGTDVKTGLYLLLELN